MFDITLAFLDQGVRKELVKEMGLSTDMPFSDFGRRHYKRGRKQGLEQGLEQGEAVGRARAVLLILETRGLEVGPRERQRILECTDCTTLDRWIEQAVVVARCEELFGT